MPDAPIYGPTTERLYARLPAVYRDEDAQQNPAHPLKRFIAGTGDQASEVERLLLRLDPRTHPLATSELLDATLGEDDWVRWLAQLVGVDLEIVEGTTERRNAVASASSGWRAGTREAIAEAARTALTGTQQVEVFDHSNATNIGTETVWDVLLLTRADETPDPAAVLETVVRLRAKPAGVTLHHRVRTADWDTLEAAYPTLNAWEAAGSWDALEQTGI